MVFAAGPPPCSARRAYSRVTRPREWRTTVVQAWPRWLLA